MACEEFRPRIVDINHSLNKIKVAKLMYSSKALFNNPYTPLIWLKMKQDEFSL